MEITVTNLTLEDITGALRRELAEYFAERPKKCPEVDEIGGIELAESITGLARATIYTRVSLRTLPHRKRGKKLYFSRKELIDWIEAGRRRTGTEIAAAAENHANGGD